jgi:hypothetical protein
MRFLNLSALIVAEANMAFTAPRGDAPTWPMRGKRITAAIRDHRRLPIAHLEWYTMPRAVAHYSVFERVVFVILGHEKPPSHRASAVKG